MQTRRLQGARNHVAGAMAEKSVLRYYEAHGWVLRVERWRGESGEIDLVMERDGDLVFVEVKASRDHARAALLLGPKQMARLAHAAEEYVANVARDPFVERRIDVALVDGAGRVSVIENALM